MKRLTGTQLQRLLEFIRTAYELRDLDAFVRHAVQTLPSVVPSDLTIYGELNPRRRRFHWVWDPPQRTFPSAQETFAALASDHPFYRLYRGGGDGSARKVSDVVSLREFQRTALYNEVFRRIKIDHEMIVWLPVPRPIEINFGVHRERRDFTETDRLLLDLLRPHLVQAYRNAETVTQLGVNHRTLFDGFGALRHGAILLDADLRVLEMNARASELVTRYFGKRRQPLSLPVQIRTWLVRQVSSDIIELLEPLTIDQATTRLIVRLLHRTGRLLLILDEQWTVLLPEVLMPLGITRREAEILAWIAQGKSNDDIATILGVAGRSVEKHVENILRKLNVESRTAAAAMALARFRTES